MIFFEAHPLTDGAPGDRINRARTKPEFPLPGPDPAEYPQKRQGFRIRT